MRPAQVSDFAPNQRQKQFLTVPAVTLPWDPAGSTMILGAIGGYGGGKSRVCEEEFSELAMTFMGGRSLAVRKSVVGRGEQSVEDDLRQIAQSRGWGRHYPSDHEIRWASGHETTVLPANDWERFGSIDVTHWFVQEAHEIKDPQILRVLSSRLRDPHAVRDGRLYYRGLFDARGVDNKHWISADFIDRAWNIDSGPGRRNQAQNPNWIYVRFQTSDNEKHLPPGYEARLRQENLNNEAWIKVFIEGEIGISIEGRPVFEGYYFPSLHQAEIDEDPTLPVLRGWDFGYRRPGVVFCQYTRSGRLLVLGECCPTDLSTDDLIIQVKAEQSRLFRNRRPESYIDYGDIQGEAVSSSGRRDAELVENAFGNELIAKKGSIEPGLNDLRRLMKDSVTVRGASLRRFAVDPNNAPNTVSALTGSYSYQPDKTKNEPVKGTTYSALVDGLRYIAQQVIEETPKLERPWSTSNTSYASFGRLRY